MRINVRVIPRSGKNLIEWEEGGLKVRLTDKIVEITGMAAEAIEKKIKEKTFP